MRINGLDLSVAAAQLTSLFDVEPMFQRRGRNVAKYEDPSTLAFELKPHVPGHDQAVYEELCRQTFRRTISMIANAGGGLAESEILKEWGQSAMSEDALSAILTRAIELGLLACEGNQFSLVRRTVDFGATLEWCVAYCFLKEFSCPAFWGVEVQGLPSDYDVIVRRETSVGYIECKSGKLGNITKDEVHNFLIREQALAPSFSIFYTDAVSRNRITPLVEFARSFHAEYVYEAPGMIDHVDLEVEEFKHFVRLKPINCFFVPSASNLPDHFREILRFLSMVCDRPMPYENSAAKSTFR